MSYPGREVVEAIGAWEARCMLTRAGADNHRGPTMRSRTPFVALSIASQVIAFGCVAQRASQPLESVLLAASHQAASHDDLLGIQALEPKALGAPGAGAERQGSRLTLHLKSGAARSYENRPECGIPEEEAKCHMYVLVAHAFSRSTFVLAKFYYESAEYLLVDDATGVETVLRAFPEFSPSGEHVLVLLVDDEQVGSEVQMWRRDGNKFVLEWSGSPLHAEGYDTSYRLVRWPEENTVVLSASDSADPGDWRRFDLRHLDDGWHATAAQ